MKKDSMDDAAPSKAVGAVCDVGRGNDGSRARSKGKRERKPKPTVPLSEKLALSVPEVIAATSFGQTTIYQAIKDKKLIVRKLGTRTVALRSDLEAFLNTLPPANG